MADCSPAIQDVLRANAKGSCNGTCSEAHRSCGRWPSPARGSGPQRRKAASSTAACNNSRYKQTQPCQFDFEDHRMFRSRVSNDATTRPATSADRNDIKHPAEEASYTERGRSLGVEVETSSSLHKGWAPAGFSRAEGRKQVARLLARRAWRCARQESALRPAISIKARIGLRHIFATKNSIFKRTLSNYNFAVLHCHRINLHQHCTLLL